MASAGNSSGSGFSWRIFGITHGDVELAFSDGSNSNLVLMYSGAINAGDVPSFSGLAEAGDRLTRLMLSFYPTSADPDVGLTVAAPQDYRGTENVFVYDDSACSVSRSGGRLTVLCCPCAAWPWSAWSAGVAGVAGDRRELPPCAA